MKHFSRSKWAQWKKKNGKNTRTAHREGERENGVEEEEEKEQIFQQPGKMNFQFFLSHISQADERYTHKTTNKQWPGAHEKHPRTLQKMKISTPTHRPCHLSFQFVFDFITFQNVLCIPCFRYLTFKANFRSWKMHTREINFAECSKLWTTSWNFFFFFFWKLFYANTAMDEVEVAHVVCVVWSFSLLDRLFMIEKFTLSFLLSWNFFHAQDTETELFHVVSISLFYWEY